MSGNPPDMAKSLEALRPTRWERIVSRVAPGTAERMYQTRTAMDMTALAGAWVGARSDVRSLRNWSADPGSADGSNTLDLYQLRPRSRDLVRNGGLAASIIKKQVLYTAGDRIRVNPTPDFDALEDLGVTVSEEARKEWVRKARRIWQYHEAHLDVERKHHGADLDDIVIRAVLESGDVGVLRRFVERPGSAYGTKLQIIEADRISTPRERGAILPYLHGDPSQLKILDGVERDLTTGEPVAYHVRSSHPGDLIHQTALMDMQWTRLPAFDDRLGQRLFLQPFLTGRPSQTRGVPLLAPVIEELKQLSNYIDAELMAAVIASYFTVFIKKVGAGGLANMGGVPGTSTAKSKTLADEVALGRGAIIPLNRDEDVEVADPSRPNSDANEFIEGMAAVIGAASDTPKEIVLSTFKSSYSASRASLLEMWRGAKARRGWFYREYKDPTYSWVITEATARGDLDSPGFFDDPMVQQAWCRTLWIGDPQGQIDPAKETQAAKTLSELGIGTKTRTTIELTGGDFEADAQRRAEEKELEDELGLTPEPPEPPAGFGGGDGGEGNEPPSREEIDDE